MVHGIGASHKSSMAPAGGSSGAFASYGKNNLVKRVYSVLFATQFADWTLYTIAAMADGALSGVFLDLSALAAIGICAMFNSLIYLLVSAFNRGLSINMGNALGRGNTREANIIFTQLTITQVVLMLPFIAAGVFFPEQLVVLFGAHDPVVAAYAVPYLRLIAISMLLEIAVDVLYQGMHCT